MGLRKAAMFDEFPRAMYSKMGPGMRSFKRMAQSRILLRH